MLSGTVRLMYIGQAQWNASINQRRITQSPPHITRPRPVQVSDTGAAHRRHHVECHETSRSALQSTTIMRCNMPELASQTMPLE